MQLRHVPAPRSRQKWTGPGERTAVCKGLVGVQVRGKWGGGGTWQRSQKMRGGRGKRHEGGTNLEALDTAAQTQANLFLLSCLGDFHTEELLLGAVTVVPVK